MGGGSRPGPPTADEGPGLRGARVSVVGLGIEGVDLVRFLTAEGADVTVSDARTAEALSESLAAIEGCEAVLSLGANRPEAAAGAEVVFVSQGVPSSNPVLREATERGIPISSMLGLFLERCPAPVTGITGSAGKTTTTSLVGAMLDTAGVEHVVGGNIGVGLLSLLGDIGRDTCVVAEISHSQLERLSTSPHIACVTNVTPNHLDRYSWSEYVDLKGRILRHQAIDDVAVLNLDNDITRGFVARAPGRVVTTSARGAIPGDGAVLAGGAILRTLRGETVEVMQRDQIALRGDHNVENVLAAVAVASQLGLGTEVMGRAVSAFSGVEHRLEPVATVAGVQYVNDSIASSPTRTVAGLRSCTSPVVLLLGGRDRQLPKRDLGLEAARRCRAVVTFGEAGHLYAAAVRDAAGGDAVPVQEVSTVEEAVEAASTLALEGDVVLFSPAGASFDAYRNFEERGGAFRDAVHQLATAS
jgi:UDP-N-acetylmuramoylalanine--D-glutamate ligase